jgi:PPOX class probable F420-dependent enzyme
MQVPPEARGLIELGRLAHLVTLNHDGSPQVSCVWVGVENDEIVSAHLSDRQRKLRNVRRDPRVSLSIEGSEIQPPGLLPYLASTAARASPRAARRSSCRSWRTATSALT